MSWGIGSSGHSGGAYQSIVGPGYSYAVISSATDSVDDPPERRCSLAGERRCSRDRAHGDERRHSRDNCHSHHHDHHHGHCHCHDHGHDRSHSNSHSHSQGHRHSREQTRTSVEKRRSREHTLSGSSHRGSSEMSRSQHTRDRAATGPFGGPFGSFASGLTLPKSTLAKSALEMSDVEGGVGSKSTKPTNSLHRLSTTRSRSNTYNSMRRKSGSIVSTSSIGAKPAMTIRKRSSNIPNGRVRPRGVRPTEGTVDLTTRRQSTTGMKDKSQRRGSKIIGGSFWGSCFGA